MNYMRIYFGSYHYIVYYIIIFLKLFIAYNRREKDLYMYFCLNTLLKKFGFKNRWKHFLMRVSI